MSEMIKEACVETIEEAIVAQDNGADQIEFCSRLDVDGLTPDRNLTRKLLNMLRIPVKVMIRPRPGDFIYSKAEFEEMKDDISFFKTLGILGVVFGILNKNNQLNLQQIKILSELASPLEVTVHKAIDLCEDPIFEVERLLGIQSVNSVLTSGKAPSALEGVEMIRAMIAKAAKQIQIIAAGKITFSNLESIDNLIEGPAYHGRKIVDLRTI